MYTLPTGYHNLPSELLAKSFEELKLADLMTVQLVCSVWRGSAALEYLWKRIAAQNFIPLNEGLSIRATLLTSFQCYCRAARVLFPQATCTIPIDSNAAFE